MRGPSTLKLFNFFMNRNFSQDGVELLQLQSLCGVFSVLGRNVPGCTWKSTGFMLCAFHDHLNSVTFLSHRSVIFLVQVILSDNNVTVFLCLFQYSTDTLLIDGSQCLGAHLQCNPSVFLGNVKALLVQVWIKLTLGLIIRMRNIISYPSPLTSYVTNFCHDI